MAASDRAFPPALTAVAEVTFDYDDGVDYEPYGEFLPAAGGAGGHRRAVRAGSPRPAKAVIGGAVQEFPDFGRTIDALCD